MRQGELILARTPAYASLHKLMEARMLPGAMVVPPGGVEDSSAAVGSNPGPRFVRFPFLAGLENGAIFFVVMGVYIGLVPALEALVPFHDRMLRLDVVDAEDLASVPLELGAYQRDVFRRVEKAIGRAVQGDEALSSLNEVKESLFLGPGNLSNVGVDDQAIVGGQLVGVEVFDPVGVLNIDSSGLENGDQLPGSFEGTMVSIVAEEES